MKKLFITLFLLMLTATFAHSEVVVNAQRAVDDTKDWVMITLTVDGDVCRYTTVVPWNGDVASTLTGQALTDYCNAKEDRYTLNILKGMYPGARPERVEGNTLLEDALAWIAAGHTNTAYCRKAEGTTEQECQDNGGMWIPEQMIEKVPWVDSWSASKVQAEKDMKTSILANKTDAQIATYINEHVTDLQSSKLFLYRLTKEVRDIIRRKGWE